MAKNAFGDENNPWHSGDVTTFANQAQNLSEQAGTAGLNTDQIDIQKQTAQAERDAAARAQKATAGVEKAANGEKKRSKSDVVQPKIEPPDTNITYSPDPSVVVDNIANETTNPVFSQYENFTPHAEEYINSLPENKKYDYVFNGGLDPKSDPQYANFIHNKYAEQLQKLQQEYQKIQNGIVNQNNEKNLAISNYVESLQKSLKDYQDSTKDVGNIGNKSQAEIESRDKNAILADQNNSNAVALNALAGGINRGNRNANALSQQAESAAINDARTRAAANQGMEKGAANLQSQAQKEQEKAYSEGGTSIVDKQNKYLKDLRTSNVKTQKELSELYNKASSNLSKSEQEFVNHAQNRIVDSYTKPAQVEKAANTYANTVGKYLSSNSVSPEEKNNIKNSLESVWRIAVGSHPDQGIEYSNKIASTLQPILNQLNGNNQEMGGK